VIAAVNRLLAPYGGRGAYGRIDHPSHRRVDDEIRILQGLAVAFPLVFLSVAAFMTNSVMSRQIALQREQIAMLKACGFSNRQIGGHYFKFSLAIVVAGVAVGTLGGIGLGHELVGMYHLFFRFPSLEFLLDTRVLGVAAAVSALAAFAGVAGAVRRAVRLPPAEAMRPEAPASYRPALVERLGVGRWFSPSLRMALRNIQRRPVRSGLTCLALALATGILIVPNSFRDGVAYVIDFQWDVVQRQTVTLSLVEPQAARAIADFRHIPGVVWAEPFRFVPVELRAGPITRRLMLQGLPAQGTLSRVIDAQPRQLPLPGAASSCRPSWHRGVGGAAGGGSRGPGAGGARPGDHGAGGRAGGGFCRDGGLHAAAGAEPAVAGRRPDQRGARRGGQGPLGRISRGGEGDSAHRRVCDQGLVARRLPPDHGREHRAAAEDLPDVRDDRGLRDHLQQCADFALGAARELATLRVLGFSRGEVGAVLVGELVLLTLVALPFGLVLGSGFARGILSTVNTETVRLPLVLTPANYAFAVLVVAVASALSALFAARKLADIDLVSALKAVD
jgi:putative ABC transport system permease protein